MSKSIQHFLEVREQIVNKVLNNGMIYDEVVNLSSYYRENEDELDSIAEDGGLYDCFVDILNEMANVDFLAYTQEFEIVSRLREKLKKELSSE